MRKSKGFTLIELLVVMFIIGLLATLVIVNVSSSRVTARDTKRQADIKTLRTAIEGYYQSHSNYPECVYSGTGNADQIERNQSQQPDYDNSLKCIDIAHSASYLYTNLVPQYLPAMPKDPIATTDLSLNYGSHDYLYARSVDGESYAFLVIFENPIVGTTTKCRTGINMPNVWFNASYPTITTPDCPF